ncbi:MAG TPA: cytochrome c [Vicinamibacterales bacterium]|jgi:cytochrome c556
MRRFFVCTSVLMLALTGTVTLAQKVTTPDELDKAMKKIAPAQGAAGKAIQSMAWPDAKAQIAIVKQSLADTESFWVSHKKDDAVKMLKDSISKVTAVEEAVSAPMPDQQTVLAAFKQVGATCAACHKQYREQDENQQYRLKAGSI